MLATLFLAAALTVGPEHPLSQEVDMVPAPSDTPSIAVAGGRELFTWTAYRDVRPEQPIRYRSAKGRIVGRPGDFEIFPSLPYALGVTTDGDSFYALTLNEDRFPTWRKIGRNGELGPVRVLEAVDSAAWSMTATSSRLVFASRDRILITDHDGKVLKEVKPAHPVSSGLTILGDDIYFIEAEMQQPYGDGTFKFWLTRLTPTGEMSTDPVGTFKDLYSGSFGLLEGNGKFLLTVFRSSDQHDEALGLLITPGAPIPPSPELIPLVGPRNMKGSFGWALGWDGHEFGIAWSDFRDDRLVVNLTRIGVDGKPAATDVIGSGFFPDGFVTTAGGMTLLATSRYEMPNVVAMSAPSFATMVREKPKPEPLLTEASIQHSVAFDGKLAVWSEGGVEQTAIRGRFLPDGHPFTIAPQTHINRSATSVVATRNGYVVAWWESENYLSIPRVVLQQIGRKGALLKRREVTGCPFDALTWTKPAIASNGETIALVSNDPATRQNVRLRLFNAALEPIAASPIAETANDHPIALASFHTVVPAPKPAGGHVVWNGRDYVVAWLADSTVKYALVDEYGTAGKTVPLPDLNWSTLQTTTRASEVIAVGTAFAPPDWNICLEIATLRGKRLGAVHCVPFRPKNYQSIQPVLFHDLIFITKRRGDASDVFAAPIEPNAELACVSCTSDNEQRPAAALLS